MKKLLSLTLCLLLLCGCGITRFDKVSPLRQFADRETAEQVRRLCAAFYEDQQLTGMSVGILKDGEVTFYNFGVKEAGGSPVTEETVYELGTMTELFTGIMFSEWVSRGYLTEDQPLATYFPLTNLPQWKGEEVTSRNLALHRSGLALQPDNLSEGDNPYAEYTELNVRKYLSTAQLEFAPGSQYRYSTLDYGMLGYLMQNALKRPFEAMVKDAIMYRVGMYSTGAVLSEENLADRAMPHDADGNPVSVQDYASLQGAAGFKSNAYDMMLFALNCLGQTEVDAKLQTAIELATTEQYVDDTIRIGYGCDLGELDGQTMVYKEGWGGGYGSAFGYMKESGVAAVVLTNNAQPVGELLTQILQAMR